MMTLLANEYAYEVELNTGWGRAGQGGLFYNNFWRIQEKKKRFLKIGPFCPDFRFVFCGRFIDYRRVLMW